MYNIASPNKTNKTIWKVFLTILLMMGIINPLVPSLANDRDPTINIPIKEQDCGELARTLRVLQKDKEKLLDFSPYAARRNFKARNKSIKKHDIKIQNIETVLKGEKDSKKKKALKKELRQVKKDKKTDKRYADNFLTELYDNEDDLAAVESRIKAVKKSMAGC